jgi:hypothetical protein
MTPDFLRLILGGGDGDDDYLPPQPLPPLQPQVQSRNHQQQPQRSNNSCPTSANSTFRNDKFNTEPTVSLFDPRHANKDALTSRHREKIIRLEIKALNIVQCRENIDDEYILQFAEHFDQLNLSKNCLKEFLTYFQNRLNESKTKNRNIFIDKLCIKQEKF